MTDKIDYTAKTFNKRHMIDFIYRKKINRYLPKYHVAPIVSIILEELWEEIITHGELPIKHFGTFELLKIKDRMMGTYFTDGKKIFKGTIKLRFRIWKKIKFVLRVIKDVAKPDEGDYTGGK